jgi:hypothetical protein
MNRTGVLVAAVLTAGIVTPGWAQQTNPTSISSSFGSSAPRFVPLDVWQRMLERPEDAPEAMIVEGTADVVWGALEGVFKELDVPTGFSDKSAGELGVVRAKLYKRMGKRSLSQYLRCGEGTAGPNADMYVVYVSVLGFVKPAGAGKQAAYGMITGHAQDLPNGRNDIVPCTSSGSFETLVVKALAKRLLVQQ